MARDIADIEGIGPAYSEKLKAAGVDTVEQLLKMCCDKKGRKAMAEETGISEKSILTWVNHADLFRINGIGPQYAELLEAAGVDTVKELATRNPENLHAKVEEVHEAATQKLVRQTPGEANIRKWIEEAGNLDPVVTH